MTRRVFETIGAVTASLAVSTVGAHHTYAQFDATKPLTLVGTVKQLQWTNPHCYVQLVVPDSGALAEWSLEADSPAVLYRVGWRPGTFMPGDKVTIIINPAKDGTHGGYITSAIDARGTVLRSPHPLR
jgi:hypothetical protein